MNIKNKSIFLCTAGRCGTHWVRPILAQILNLEVGLQGHNPNIVPFQTEPSYIWIIKMKEKRDPGGNIYTGHMPINNIMPIINLVNIVLLIRDPRDMCISAAYYYNTVQIEYFMKDFDFRLKSLLYQGGPNSDFNQSYMSYKEKIPHILIKYEEMIHDGYKTIVKVLNAFKYVYDEERLKDVLGNNTFKKLSRGREAGDEDRNAFYRKGIIGDWKNYLTEEQNKKFCNRHRVLMREWGYI